MATNSYGGGSALSMQLDVAKENISLMDPMNWGANAIYDIVDNKLVSISQPFKMPAPQKETENCGLHCHVHLLIDKIGAMKGGPIPIPGRDINALSKHGINPLHYCGISVIDFTDSFFQTKLKSHTFDRGPILDDEQEN